MSRGLFPLLDENSKAKKFVCLTEYTTTMKHLAHLLTALIAVEVVVGISFNPVFSNRPQLPRGSQLVEIPNNVGLGSANGHIAYFGDFNSDKFSDIFIVDAARTSGSFWLWNSAKWQFEQSTSSQITSEGSQTILDVIATDFNRDGKLDLLVQTGAEQGAKNIRLFVYFGNTTHFTSQMELPSAADVVSVIDYNGDLFPDLIGAYAATNATAKLSIWLNGKENPTNFTVQEFPTPLTLASGSAIGFVDMNGDCMPDLFIPIVDSDGVVSYDVWINGPEQFTHARTIKGINGLGSPSFADFDADGTTDIIFPYCATSNCTQLIVLYNQQMPVCSAEVSKNCRSLEALCQADDNWAVSDISTAASATLAVIDLAAPLAISPHFPTKLVRVGDVDLDGYPDLLLSIVDPSSGRRMALYHNVPCTGDLKCVDAAVSAGRRAFTELTQGTSALVNLRGAFAAAFFDLDDDGTNDIVVLAESNAAASSVTRNITALFNNYDNDAYFLKMIALSGVCINWCDVTPDPKPWGVNQHGAIFKWTAADLDNIRRTVQVSQLTQSSHLALQPPYFFGGLGRPSNYVDYLYLGLSVRNKEKGSSMMWSGIIPNSQVVTVPYPPEEPISWTAELYVSPGSYVVWIAIAVVAWLVAVGVVIIILQVREKQEDNKAKKEREHLFSFKAL